MKLNNNQVYALATAGMAQLNYSKISSPADAYNAFVLRREVMKAFQAAEQEKREIIGAAWEEGELEKAVAWEQEKKGSEEEYNALIAKVNAKVQPLLNEMAKREVEIDTAVSFKSWLELLRANEWLAGKEDILTDFIRE